MEEEIQESFPMSVCHAVMYENHITGTTAVFRLTGATAVIAR
jgi:hypothetical protein